nr:hypothetical protein L203_00245 [Cryptococcus depauperatus CBS 7841]
MKKLKAADKEFRAAKFSPRFQGPYKITEAYCYSPTITLTEMEGCPTVESGRDTYQERSVYKLDFPNGSRDQFTKFHDSLLKPYLSSSRFGQVSPSTLPLPETGPERYRVHHILDHRRHRGKDPLRAVLPGSGPSRK